jgi:hypothetical protein
VLANLSSSPESSWRHCPSKGCGQKCIDLRRVSIPQHALCRMHEEELGLEEGVGRYWNIGGDGRTGCSEGGWFAAGSSDETG